MDKYIKYKLKYLELKQNGGYNIYKKHLYTKIEIEEPIHKTIIKYNNNNFIVYDDSKIVGGTKSRLIRLLVSKVEEDEIVYAGPATGLAHVALAYNAHKYNKKAVVFLSGYDKDKKELVELSKKYGAKVIISEVGTLKNAQDIAKEYVNKKENRYLFPFGLRNLTNFRFFKVALEQALSNEKPPKRLWIVAGSGFLFEVLHDIWPNTHFMIVQVGKKIWPDQLYNIKHTLFIAPERFTEDAKSQPPYNTIPWYDAKLWQFFEKYNKEGDCIWNVGGL